MNSKLHLSKQETELVNNTEWILTKRAIINKVCDCFGELQLEMREIAKANSSLFPQNTIEHTGKISRGENYKGLPYVILDYPAKFERDNLFAVRTMFWWGNFFNVTLHVSGKNVEAIRQNSEAVFSFLKENNFFICISEDEWKHEFEENYLPAVEVKESEMKKIYERSFFKISKKISLNEEINVPEYLFSSFKEIIDLLQISFPGGKTNL